MAKDVFSQGIEPTAPPAVETPKTETPIESEKPASFAADVPPMGNLNPPFGITLPVKTEEKS